MSAVLNRKVSKTTPLSNPVNTNVSTKIFLIGMMGSGKSFWAEKLKKKLKLPAYDLDALVEMMEEKSVAELFKEDGEEYFRKAESKMLRLFAEKKQFIVSCGGGTASYGDNMKWMNKHGITIWIDEPVETLTERLLDQKEHRPLIKDLSDTEVAAFLQTKLEERQPFYSQATYRLAGSELNENAFLKIAREHA